ncbi:MAG: DUF3426 domain-containing protein [Desulfuromonadaceae bacterium]|nr:DUF3426 domain-containing protein [Desulfuromonadaceae bacterium]
MIIRCEKCQTRFRLDDSRVTDKGVKVRCTKCKHVFRVQKEEADVEPVESEAATADFSTSAEQNDIPMTTSQYQPLTENLVHDTPFDSGAFETAPADSVNEINSFEMPLFEDSTASFGTDEFHGVDAENVSVVPAEPAASMGEVDFSSFDFGESDSEPDVTPPPSVSLDNFSNGGFESASDAPRKESPQGLDFSDDDLFGAVVPAAPETADDTISFDFEEDDSFAESMDMSSHDASAKSGTLFSLDTHGDVPFNLGEIDFGDELTSVAVQQVNPEDLQPSQEILFAPLAEAQGKPAPEDVPRSFSESEFADYQHELPPLSITSRRKRNPLFGALIGGIALVVITALVYFGITSFSTPKDMAATENGKIGIQAVKATFIENAKAGELLVISGEALNEYSQPRAALQVKVTVFDASGKSIATKSAYGGNPLTEEQLKSLAFDKIEAAMANQFGDSLTNMEVAPGKSIPFVVVIANLPAGASDFGVQSAGSTVATGRQQ